MKLIPGTHPKFKQWLEELPYLELLLMEAEESLLSPLSRKDKEGRAGISCARACRMEEDPKSQWMLLRKGLDILPNEPMLNMLAGMVASDPGWAMVYFYRAITFAQKYQAAEIGLEASLGYANALAEVGRPKDAREVFNHAMQHNPGDPHAYGLLQTKILWNLLPEPELEQWLFHDAKPDTTLFEPMNRALFLLEKKQDPAAAEPYLIEANNRNPFVLNALIGKIWMPVYAGRYWIPGSWSEARMYMRIYGGMWNRKNKKKIKDLGV